MGHMGRHEGEAPVFQVIELGSCLVERHLITGCFEEFPAGGPQLFLPTVKDGSLLQGGLGEEALLDCGELANKFV